jgi:predicted transcriptional regulator
VMLISARLDRKISQRELAKETGIDHCCIARIERGMKIDVLHYISLMEWMVRNYHKY